jgi:hypothetical protein
LAVYRIRKHAGADETELDKLKAEYINGGGSLTELK